MSRDLDAPKASPESVARAIFDAVEKGEEDIFPDPVSQTGGTWLLDTVGGTLEQQSRAGNSGIMLAVWAAAVLKVIGAIVPLAAVGVIPGQALIARRRLVRVLAWLEAAILTIYGMVLTIAGLLVQSGVIAAAPSADHRALAWHAYLWDPWFFLWGVLVTAALTGSRQPGAAQIARGR